MIPAALYFAAGAFAIGGPAIIAWLRARSELRFQRNLNLILGRVIKRESVWTEAAP